MVFALTTLKPLFRLSRALLDIQKCILSSAIKFVSFRTYQGNLSLFEITGALVFIFSRQFQLQLHCKSFTKGRIFLIPLCIAFSIPNISGFLFLRKKELNLGSEMGRIKLQKILGNLLDKLRKLYMNGTVIQKFLTFLKLQKTLSNFCFSEQIFHRKPSLGAPVFCRSLRRRRGCSSSLSALPRETILDIRRFQSLKDPRFDGKTQRKRLQKRIAERLTIRAQKASFSADFT